MSIRKLIAFLLPGILCAITPAFLRAQNKPAQAEVQPAVEQIDLTMYSRIRDEGFSHSRIMEYAGVLLDDIGPRLTGSPAMQRAHEWTRQQLAAMGCSNAHVESWGEFGMAWTHINSSLALVKPSPGVMLAEATPWSPATNGVVTAEVIHIGGIRAEEGLAPWKGKLKGKVILYGEGENPDVDPDAMPTMKHFDAAHLASIAQYPINGDMSEQYVTPFGSGVGKIATDIALKEKVAKFFADEGALAMLVPGSSGGILHDDFNSSVSRIFAYRPEHKQPIPSEVVSAEAWSRMDRLLDHHVPVTVTLSIAAEFGDEHAKGYNTLAEITGTDPRLKDEVVLVGGHLDSWIAGTGATDNGAGSITAMEAMRILNALHIKPRRTIRIALWGGEEQGLLASTGYVANHLATFHYSTVKEEVGLPPFIRTMDSPPTLKPEGEKFDVYFNMDNGTGKLLGIYTEGNQAISEIFSQWMKPIVDLGMTTVSERNTGSTDHVPFQQAGLPGFQFIQDPRDSDSRTHHTNLDTYDHLSEPDLKQAAVVEAIFLYNAAMRDAMLPRSGITANTPDKPLEGLYPDATK